jgi:PAS domain S-box-containing protein
MSMQKWKRIICLVFSLSVFLCASWASGKEANLTDQERAWIAAHPIIRLAPDPEFRPIEYFDEKGNYVGMAADYARVIGQKLGIKFEIVRCANWDDVMDRTKRREVDVLNAVVKTPQREAFLRFPVPYLKIPSVIIVRKNVERGLTLGMMRGMNIVMVSGYGYVDLIRNQYPQLKIDLVPDLKTSLRKVSFGMADAFVGDLATASYYMESEGITNLRLAGETEPPNISGFAVRSDWPELSLMLEKGIALLTEEEQKNIYRKWIRLESEPTLTMREFRNLMLILAGIIILVVFGFLLWNRTLRRMVHLRTEDLQKEIDEHKRDKEALRDTENRYRSLFEYSPDGIVTIDPATARPVEFNENAHRQLGYSREEFAGLSIFDLEVAETPEETRSRIAQVIREGRADFETRQRTRQGEVRNVYVTAQLIEISGKQIYHCVWRDITKRKQAEKALKESEEKYRLIAENMTDVISIVDMNMRFTFVSPSIMRLRGFTVEEVIAQPLEQVMTPESLLFSYRTYEEEMRLESSGTADPNRYRIIELEEYKKDMSTVWVEVTLSFLRDVDGRPIGILSLTRDIDARKRAEEALRESEEKYRELVKNAPAGIYEVDYETNRFISVNDVICEYTGYTREELSTMNLFNLLTKESQKLMLVRFEKLMAGEKLEPTVEYCIRTKDGNELWGLFNARYIYEAGKLKGATGVIYNITDRKQADKKLQDTLESLRKAVGTTIQVMASAVETRDPYTAGHQIRSAGLARAIATEMGLPKDKIEGIRMAGSIHDIGKLSIPAEILSKPTKLSDIELRLIKEHAHQGYEILKDVVSPWPLAEIVRQHHERMDGSGYPRNLKGDDILIEARILTVADVVEAMASHRPYRPGLGIDAALNEIEKNRGTIYDKTVADACLKIFREKGFKLEGA